MALAMETVFAPAAPVLAPTSAGSAFPVGRIFCVGRNYAAHAREMGMDPTREPPFFFTKWAAAVVPSGATISYPQATADYHHEGELVVAIGRGGRAIDRARALDHVWGYACGLDMTRRDIQAAAREAGRPWDAAKNVEASAPLGLIHAVAEVGHLAGAQLTLTLNGRERQAAAIADMIWPVADVIAHLSRLWPLEAGDLVYTGTPAGVGPVVPGDRLVVSVTGLTDLIVTIGPPA